MQSDEDVGKIAMAVPLLVSKALELFLQDLCDRTYDITTQCGAKTMSPSHLKHCVQSFNVFDFLREIVRGVSDLGVSSAGAENQPIAKRRKLTDHEYDGNEESSRSKMATGHATTSGSGRGQGRGRGRSSQANEVGKYEDDPDTYDKTHDLHEEAADQSLDFKGNASQTKSTEIGVRNFDLNMELDEDGNFPSASTSTSGPGPDTSATKFGPEVTHDNYPGWSLSELEKMGVDSVELLSLDQRIEEDEEDYDKEE